LVWALGLRVLVALQIEPKRADFLGAVVPEFVRLAGAVGNQVAAAQLKWRPINLDTQRPIEHEAILIKSSKADCTTWGGDARQWAPKSTVTTTVLDWGVVMDDLVKQQRTGAIKAQAFDLTFGNGGLKVPDFAADSAVAPALQAEFKKTIDDLASGKVALPASKVHPGLR
jgi:basic membrane lipoprotein Med (substrate-binding protein (PBP1-ABC) superfamily)